MRPKEPEATPQPYLFRPKLVNLIDLRHELCRLAGKTEWADLSKDFGARRWSRTQEIRWYPTEEIEWSPSEEILHGHTTMLTDHRSKPVL